MTIEFFKYKYGYEIEGMWMPRVTAITSLVSKASMFAPRASADWGTLVHETIGRSLKGDFQATDPRIGPTLRAFEQWKQEYHMEVRDLASIEKRVFDPEYFFAGTVDFIAHIQGDAGVIDLKTSSMIREEHLLQTAAYFAAYNKGVSSSTQCTKRGILRIDQFEECAGCFAKKRKKGARATVSEGNPLCNHQWNTIQGHIEFKELENQEEDFQAFLAAKEVWEWYYRSMLKRIANYPKRVTQKILL